MSTRLWPVSDRAAVGAAGVEINAGFVDIFRLATAKKSFEEPHRYDSSSDWAMNSEAGNSSNRSRSKARTKLRAR